MAKQTWSYDRPEFTATSVRHWLSQVEEKTRFIEPGNPWENGTIESFNGKLRDKLLNGEIFETMLEAKVLIERWRVTYKTIRPPSAQCTAHSALGCQPRHQKTYRLTSPLARSGSGLVRLEKARSIH